MYITGKQMKTSNTRHNAWQMERPPSAPSHIDKLLGVGGTGITVIGETEGGRGACVTFSLISSRSLSTLFMNCFTSLSAFSSLVTDALSSKDIKGGTEA